ncbi:LysR substrate-binding domain-containing protein [Gardnerella vaginalis]|uniref:Probable hydrogen peroxide-inducible genes activator n=1 Tax=Gardnerella vaginalis TaxID=2702 RepID=A0A133NQK0_GARVA|nr:LysR substrate-binding domain-containing protein [Gardnerella vaginalis]KXA18518.1 putative hydrogen peroxide-inducible protein activator [Gardnerella vaginalis]
MNIKSLEYLIAFAKEESFTKAAERMHVSQPTLSTQIKKLEDLLGVCLIERTPGKQILTPAGREVVYYANRIHADISNIYQAARRLEDPWSSTVVLGVFPTLCPYLMPRIMPVLRKLKPNFTVRFVEEKSATLIEMLHSGQIDAAILSERLTESTLRVKHIFDEDFVLAASTNSEFGHQSTPIDISQLSSQKVLLLEDGHCMRRSMVDVCQKVGAKQSEFCATSLETLRYMVVGSKDVTLLPRLAILPPIVQPTGLTIREFNSPKPYRSLYLNWRAASPVDQIMEGVGKIISGVCANLHKN